jgi:hypothetical protein
MVFAAIVACLYYAAAFSYFTPFVLLAMLAIWNGKSLWAREGSLMLLVVIVTSVVLSAATVNKLHIGGHPNFLCFGCSSLADHRKIR